MSAPTPQPPTAEATPSGVPARRGELTPWAAEDPGSRGDGAELAADHRDGDEPSDDERRAAGAGVDTRRLGMARLLTDPAIEEAISAFVASAPPLPEDRRARLARLLRTSECHDPADWEQP